MSLKILIVKISSIGDIIQALAVLDYLKEFDAHIKIDWVVDQKYLSLVKNHPLIHQAISCDTKTWIRWVYSKKNFLSFFQFIKSLRKANYDCIFDLQGNCKSSFVTFLSKGKEKIGFGRKSVREKPNLLFTKFQYEVNRSQSISFQYITLFQKHFKIDFPYIPQKIALKLSSTEKEVFDKLSTSLAQIKQKKGMVCFGSMWENKRVSEEFLISFLKKMERDLDSYFVFSWGNQEEKKVCEKLHSIFTNSLILDKLSLNLWQNVMGLVDFVIGIDSCALALCGMIGTPSFSLFGPTSQTVFRPLGNQHGSIEGKCPFNIRFEKQCPSLRTCKTGGCLKELKLETVYPTFHFWYTGNFK